MILARLLVAYAMGWVFMETLFGHSVNGGASVQRLGFGVLLGLCGVLRFIYVFEVRLP